MRRMRTPTDRTFRRYPLQETEDRQPSLRWIRLCPMCQAEVSTAAPINCCPCADDSVSSIAHPLHQFRTLAAFRSPTNAHSIASCRVTRAFLIEEATIVKRVLKAKAAASKK